MNILQNRIDSFHNNSVKWPHKAKNYHKAETFAKAGFYFMRRPKTSDSLRCFLCDIELSRWKQGQSPYIRHAAESPQCPWSILNFPDASKRRLTVSDKDPSTKPRHSNMKSARMATFKHHNYWPPNKSLKSKRYPAASKLVDAGFIFHPTLENVARVTCPYCKCSIPDPEKSMDVLEKHQELSSDCAFFQPTHDIDTKNRRDTVTSNASTDTFKTASSQITDEHSIPSKRRSGSDLEKPVKLTEQDDGFWDIDEVFDVPKHIKKPAVTYGSKSIKRARHRSLPSATKQITVDIFSNAILKPALIEHSKEVEESTSVASQSVAKKPSKAKDVVPAKENQDPNELEAISPKSPAKNDIPTPSSSSTLPSKHDEPVLLSPILPATEPPSATERITTDTPLSKDKGKAVDRGTGFSPITALSLSKKRKKTAPTTSPAASPHRPEISEVTASIAKQIEYLQSTPMHGVRSTTTRSDFNTESPIVSRTRTLITDGQQLLSVNNVPTPPPMVADAPIITNEQKKMTVETYLHHIVDDNIKRIRQRGDRIISQIRGKADDIKEDLLKQKAEL